MGNVKEARDIAGAVQARAGAALGRAESGSEAAELSDLVHGLGVATERLAEELDDRLPERGMVAANAVLAHVFRCGTCDRLQLVAATGGRPAPPAECLCSKAAFAWSGLVEMHLSGLP